MQGQATLDGQPVTADATAAPRPLQAGDALTTASGHADLRMAPGALLRVGSGAQVQVVAADEHRTEVRLVAGRANVSVHHVPEGTLLLVDMPGGQVQMLKSGLYTFDTQSQTARVYHGEADAFPGANGDGTEKPIKLKEGHELVLTGGFRPEKFDSAENLDLLPWSGPQETEAALADGALGSSGFTSVGYGYGPYGDGFAYGSPYGYYTGVGYPYGWGYPYGFYGYPFFGFGVGYFGGFYGGRGYGYRGGYPVGLHGGYAGGFHGGYAGTGLRGGFAGGGFHGGGFAGGHGR